MKKWNIILAVSITLLFLGGCTAQGPEPSSETDTGSQPVQGNPQDNPSQEEAEEQADRTTEESAEEAQGPAPETAEADLAQLKALPGMSYEETADMFGGGEENWTEDKQFFIGRIFHVNLYGGEYNMYTTCSEDGIVEAVSVWIVSGERAVTDEETETWVGRVTELMGTEPVFDGESSEAGSQNWKWNADGFAAAIYRMEDTLSLYFQPAVGELK
ncbi:MAG: hypothetical protein ACOX8J_10080 [Candidatus Merdisoma sp.]